MKSRKHALNFLAKIINLQTGFPSGQKEIV